MHYLDAGNAEGALGHWSAARSHFTEAAEDSSMESIAKVIPMQLVRVDSVWASSIADVCNAEM